MTEKKMLITTAEIVKKIDENRGDLSQTDFISFLIDSQLKQDSKEQYYVTKDTLAEFEQSIKDLLRNFLEFVVSYGLELGRQPVEGKFEELDQKLEELGEAFSVSEQAGGAKG